MSELQREAVEFCDDELSAGQRLKSAREARNLSIEDVSARLNISAKYIRALEELDFESLPGLPFVRGYIRSYARFVELSGDELVVSFNRYAQVGDVGPVASINKVGRQVKLSDPLMRTSMFIFFLAVLGISVWWWQTQSGNSLPDIFNLDPAVGVDTGDSETAENESGPQTAESKLQARLAEIQTESEQQTTMSDESAETGTVNNDPTEADPEYLSAEEIQRIAAELAKTDNETDINSDTNNGEQTVDPRGAGTEVSTAGELIETAPATNDNESAVEQDSTAEAIPGTAVDDSITSTDVSNQESVVSAESEVPADDLTADTVKPVAKLELQFVGDCWVSIRDAKGKLIFANTKRAGDVLELDLEASANLLVGRVSAVSRAFFGGKDLQLAQLARKDVARLELNF
ncbi:RodZ domain-containing protein [Motiliproteus sp. MSK22-1]|uniref:RodZ domain-containing protein n=1 Tax=Motiliproteus sp. MSK22-1 TaxID=1897630 RepID=UPI0009783953|nr:RodZ domain-containing protein [Motiliproteus sp. MSK22-1]OMH30922.1 hypothetical protein BGP75_00890 [Motiliproteus sp. MSK22-1]